MIDHEIKAVIKRLRALNRKIEALDATIADARREASSQYADALADLEKLIRKRRTKTVTMGGDRFTRVQSTVTSYDPDILKDNLSPGQYELVVKEVVDTKVLETLVDRGAIKPQQVREAMSEHANKAYVKVTWRSKSSRDDVDREIPEG